MPDGIGGSRSGIICSVMLRAPYVPGETDADHRRWMDLVVTFLETGSTMAEAMIAARRVIVFTHPSKPFAPQRGSGTYLKAEARETIPSPSSTRAMPARRR